MPKISTYATVTPSPSDRFVVSDANDSNATKNITVESLSSATAPAYYIDAFSNAAATTTISAADTYVDLNVVLSTGLSDGYTATNELVSNVNTPQTTLLSQVTVVLSLKASNNNVITGLITQKTSGGTETDIVSSTSSVTETGNSTEFNLVMTCIANLVFGDSLKIKVKNSAIANIDCSHVSVVVHSI